jgi:PhnB protein
MATESTALVQPYLFFSGQCDEAIAFYQRTLGAKLEMRLTYGQSPDKAPPGFLPEGWDDKVMHATMTVGGAVIMLSDGCERAINFSGFKLSIAYANPADADAAFANLAKDGKVVMPLTRTFWSPKFGMVLDRFGMEWMITVQQ